MTNITQGPRAYHQRAGREGRKITGIVIHHWGDPGQTHDGVVRFLVSRRDSHPSSAHFVVSANRITQIVNLNNTAYHASNWLKNTTTIGIENRPEMSDADLETTCELVAKLYKMYGNLPLMGHKDITATKCPGKYYAKLAYIRKRAIEINKGKTSTTTNQSKPSIAKPSTNTSNYAKKASDWPSKALNPNTTKHDAASDGAWRNLMDNIGKKDKSLTKNIQSWLRGLGYYSKDYLIDGDFGPATVRALQSFLKAKGLYKRAVDGSRGAYTIKAEVAYLNDQRKYNK